MKRALAERAKQTESKVIDASGVPSSSSSPQEPLSRSPLSVPPPAKLARIERPSVPAVPSATTDQEPPQQPPQQPQRSPRPPPSSSKNVHKPSGTSATNASIFVTADDDSNHNAFYLKHQNRALATELFTVKDACTRLEQEREVRRRHCAVAVQALNSLQATWTQLETALTSSNNKRGNQNNADVGTTAIAGLPPSTGTGQDVEWTTALAQALAALGGGAEQASEQPPDMDLVEHAVLQDLSKLSANVADRANVLQECILQHMRGGGTARGEALLQQSQMTPANTDAATTALSEDVSALQHQVAELAASRTAALQGERRVKRNLYRCKAGMITIDQVLQALNLDENDEEWKEMEAAAKLQEDSERTVASSDQAAAAAASMDTTEPAMTTEEASFATSAEVQALRSKVTDLQHLLSNRDQSLQESSEALKEKELVINRLSAKQQSEKDVERLVALERTQQALATSQRTISELQTKLAETKGKWSQALGNETTLRRAMDELQTKHAKRWSEFTTSANGEDSNDSGTLEQASETVAIKREENEDSKMAVSGEEKEQVSSSSLMDEQQVLAQSKRIAQLEHQLGQALENVRQAESARTNLNDALSMNESLQAKLEEIKAKYAAVQAAGRAKPADATATSSTAPHESSGNATPRDSSGTNHKEPSGSTAVSDGIKAVTSSSSSSGADSKEKMEKMHREHRRMRKELAAVMASKDSAKAKLERAEKERDGLFESNARLLKQITEKDEMNAKSLSTILHLKSMTERLTLERENLEQQVKSASQLALAARLATNAKERVSEEVIKEKDALETRVAELEKQHADTKAELERITLECSEASTKMSTLNSELTNAVTRSAELIDKTKELEQEIRELKDRVEKAERQATEYKQKLDDITKSANGGDLSAAASAFSVEQLNTQINVLKGRLACPVCHYRDKECIIMRCRHMHCKQCVTERISNRSRKCPTCNNKFTEKDVEDIWLS